MKENELTDSAKRPLTAEEVAKRIGCTPQHIYTQAKLGNLPHYRIGNYIRFPANIINTHILRGTKNENEV